MRRAAKVDLNHGEIMEAVRTAGWVARSTAMVGDSFPDVCAAKGGVTVLLEVKSAGEKLTKGQEEFRATWPGAVIVAREVNQTVLDLETEYRKARRASA
jgi:hypothetical protein